MPALPGKNEMDMPDCIVVTALADEFANEIERLANFPIKIKASSPGKQALAAYTRKTALFGSPDMIADILPRMPTVDWVQSSWAGVTPLMALDRRDYVLTGIKDVFGAQMSEYVLGYLLAHELKVLQRMHEQREHNWFRGHSGTLEGKRMGIMGTGSIGQHIARTAKRFGVKVTGLSRSGAASPGFDNVLPVNELRTFLKELDYLVATLPRTAATNNLLAADALVQLPAHASFVNVGRGNVVNDEALMDALRNKRLAGAALDVFDEEPVPQDSPLWDTPNLSITAHISAISHPLLIVPVFVENYRRYVNGQPLQYVVDFATGY
ncbi:MAG: D-2-hydroxyacid dehydrogenase [Gammaproteobacteria bacterium]|nr:MAG: D-2-hydroxyacid dehydrogenase [Gammaproteobacteria bacterium]